MNPGEGRDQGRQAGYDQSFTDLAASVVKLLAAGPPERPLPDGQVVKAAALSGEDGLLFLRSSVTGVVQARRRPGGGVELNAALHSHQ